jgi:acetoin utilization deacetylase AcuC-like enzyme
MKVFYSDHYTLPLPPEHRFPMQKYQMLRNFLLSEKILQKEELQASPIVSQDLLRLAHSESYIESIRTGTVSQDIIRRIGFPWSEQLFVRSCATVGGALAAALAALDEGIAGNLAGGTHHAHEDRGEGYCVFNDIAVVSRFLQKERQVRKVAIIDLDVHQGNGNSSILFNDSDVFIFSIHGEKNYPFKKVSSHLDIALQDGTTDEMFLEHLKIGMKSVKKFNPNYIFYQMGVDPLKEDKLGRMNLTFEGLMERDHIVLSYAKTEGIPLSLALGGGYADPIELTVRAYANTYCVVKKIYGPF